MKDCYYAVLQLNRDADEKEIKTQYRRLALKWHPDKNIDAPQEAEKRFKLIQEAYETLSDANERAWYDSHREQILRGKNFNGVSPDTTEASEDPDINIWEFFDASCFTGFGDDSKGFYGVFGDVFRQIDKLESNESHNEALPPLDIGNSNSEWREVRAFYAHWTNFVSERSFCWADKWKVSDGDGRYARRAMEKENRSCRMKARKEYVEQVRELARFEKKRDPRVGAHREEKQRVEAERELAEKDKRLRQKLRREEEREIRLEMEQERMIERQKERLEAYGDVDAVDAERERERCAIHECVACDKTFKTVKQLENHCQSRKHKAAAEKLRRELELEMELSEKLDLGDAVVEDENEAEQLVNAEKRVRFEAGTKEEDPVSDAIDSKKKKKKKKRRKQQQQQQGNFGFEEMPIPAEVNTGSDNVAETELAFVDEGHEDPNDDEWSKPNKKGKKGRRRRNGNSGKTEKLEDKLDGSAVPDLPKSRRSRKGKAHASLAANRGDAVEARTEAADPKETADSELSCKRCSAAFLSRSKLFQHLKKHPSHAALRQ